MNNEEWKQKNTPSNTVAKGANTLHGSTLSFTQAKKPYPLTREAGNAYRARLGSGFHRVVRGAFSAAAPLCPSVSRVLFPSLPFD